MKKVLLSILCAAAANLAHAQSIPAGTISLGGNIGYSRSTSNNSSTYNGTTYTSESTASQFSFSPSVGFFVADNLALGINLGYTANRRVYTTTSGNTPSSPITRPELDPTTTLRLGAYAQYYKMLTEQFGVLGTLGGGFQSLHDYAYSNNSSSAAIQELKGSGYYAELTPGIVFFPIPKLGLTASIGSLAFNRISSVNRALS